VKLALKETELSPRELAVTFTDRESYFVSEASTYRILKAHDLSRVTKVHLTGLKHAAQKTGLVDVLREGNIVHQPFPASDGKALVKKMKASMPTKCASQLPELQ